MNQEDRWSLIFGVSVVIGAFIILYFSLFPRKKNSIGSFKIQSTVENLDVGTNVPVPIPIPTPTRQLEVLKIK